jgi:hypothetical protein
MKRCPKCNADYFDNMLEFCLEDGTRLAFAPQSAAVKTAPTIPAETRDNPGPIAQRVSEETVVIPGERRVPDTIAQPKSEISASIRVIERAAVGLALAHNWWQWLYLEKTYVSSITDYVLSANFLMWLLLLGAGAAAGIYSIKRSRDKTLAIISLVTLAINLILFLVPRR